jgi:hypothetical protein
MAAFEFDDRGEPLMKENLKKVGVGSDLSDEWRVRILQQRLAELLTALQKAGIKTEV